MLEKSGRTWPSWSLHPVHFSRSLARSVRPAAVRPHSSLRPSAESRSNTSLFPNHHFDHTAMPPKSKAKSGSSAPREQPLALRGYLIAFNLVSFFGWVLILSTLVKHLAVGAQMPSYPIVFSSKVLARFRPLRVFLTSTYAHVPEPLGELLRRASTTMMSLGSLVAFVQSLAILEVVHAALGWVRSPVPTTAIQVASRLFMVWGVSERFAAASGSPWYASMVLAWSVTESVRYPFYANALMGQESEGLLWAR